MPILWILIIFTSIVQCSFNPSHLVQLSVSSEYVHVGTKVYPVFNIFRYVYHDELQQPLSHSVERGHHLSSTLLSNNHLFCQIKDGESPCMGRACYESPVRYQRACMCAHTQTHNLFTGSCQPCVLMINKQGSIPLLMMAYTGLHPEY